MAETVKDGAFCEAEYKNAPVKILWLLKEALDYGQKSQAELLDAAIKEKRIGQTWTTMAYVAYAVINGWESGNFVKWEDIPTVDQGVGEILRKIALVNVSRELSTAPNGLSKNANISQAYISNADLIEEKIKALNPDIVVFGYPEALKGIVEDVFKRMTGQEYTTDKYFGTFSVTISNNRLFIWAYHPSIYRSEENGRLSKYCYYESFIESVKLFRQKSDVLNIGQSK